MQHALLQLQLHETSMLVATCQNKVAPEEFADKSNIVGDSNG